MANRSMSSFWGLNKAFYKVPYHWLSTTHEFQRNYRQYNRMVSQPYERICLTGFKLKRGQNNWQLLPPGYVGMRLFLLTLERTLRVFADRRRTPRKYQVFSFIKTMSPTEAYNNMRCTLLQLDMDCIYLGTHIFNMIEHSRSSHIQTNSSFGGTRPAVHITFINLGEGTNAHFHCVSFLSEHIAKV